MNNNFAFALLLTNDTCLVAVSDAVAAVQNNKAHCVPAVLNAMTLAAGIVDTASLIAKSDAADTVTPVGATLVVTGN